MAQAQTQTQKQAPANANQGGRPAKPEAKTPEAAARANLQYTVDRACNFIHDGTASYARRARTAARAGIDKALVLKGIDAMLAAVNDARQAVERAYAAPTKPEAPKSRVALV